MEESGASKKTKSLNITIMVDEIIGADVTKSGDYKYASIGIKRNNDEYLRISYEWKGESIPDFVMGIMGWIQANRECVDENTVKCADEYAELKHRI